MKNLYFTIVNEGYIPFVINFLRRLKEIEFKEEFLIACIDSESFNFLKNIHENVVNYNLNLSRGFEQWETENYKDIVFSKLDIKKSIIEKNKDVYDNIIFIDTDIWINKNFSDELNSILENNDYDIIFQDGEDYLFYKDECFELLENKLIQKRYCNSFCTGFMVMNSKSSEKILNFLSYKEENKKKYNGNQQYLNEKLYFENLKTLTIPKKLFPNYSICNFYKKHDYWMLHYTYLKGREKINAMKKNNHWIVDEKYQEYLHKKKQIKDQKIIKHRDNLYEIKSEWQEPNATELHYFKNHLKKDHNDFVYIGYSWANHIDKGLLLTQETIQEIKSIKEHKATVCQHIRWEHLIDVWRAMGIKTVFLSHCEKETRHSDINFKPWPLLATNYLYCNEGLSIKNVNEKKYLASFVGAYRKDYRSDIRLKLKEYFEKNQKQNIFYKLNEDWFYQKNIFENEKFDQKEHNKKALFYNTLLSDSVFSLCPEGTGPNTIRLWESMALGIIPVIYSDDWLPPQIPETDWKDFSIFIPIKDYASTIDMLTYLDQDKIKQMQVNCVVAFNKFNDRTCRDFL